MQALLEVAHLQHVLSRLSVQMWESVKSCVLDCWLAVRCFIYF